MGCRACTVGSVECATVRDEARRVSINISIQKRRSKRGHSKQNWHLWASFRFYPERNSRLVRGIKLRRSVRHRQLLQFSPSGNDRALHSSRCRPIRSHWLRNFCLHRRTVETQSVGLQLRVWKYGRLKRLYNWGDSVGMHFWSKPSVQSFV